MIPISILSGLRKEVIIISMKHLQCLFNVIDLSLNILLLHFLNSSPLKTHLRSGYLVEGAWSGSWARSNAVYRYAVISAQSSLKQKNRKNKYQFY